MQDRASVASLELTDDGRIRVLIGSTEMGQGTKTIFPQLVAEELGVADEDVEIARPGHRRSCPTAGPTVASRTAMVVGGLWSSRPRGGCGRRSRRATGRPFAESYRDYAREHGRVRIDQRFEPYPGIAVRRRDVHAATPTLLRLGGCAWPTSTSTWTPARWRSATSSPPTTSGASSIRSWPRARSRAARCRRSATRRSRRSSSIDGRYLNDRLATYLIPTALDAPRIETILVEKPFSGAPHGAKGVGELPMDVGAPAVVAAIHDATGVWIHDLPATPERILAALPALAPRRSAACRGEPAPERGAA